MGLITLSNCRCQLSYLHLLAPTRPLICVSPLQVVHIAVEGEERQQDLPHTTSPPISSPSKADAASPTNTTITESTLRRIDEACDACLAGVHTSRTRSIHGQCKQGALASQRSQPSGDSLRVSCLTTMTASHCQSRSLPHLLF